MREAIYFISDLHLSAERTVMNQLFFDFLAVMKERAKALYILGDLFESWVGDSDRSPFHEQVKAALQAVTAQGIPVHIMHGNRDFLLGRAFMRATGCRLLGDPSVIPLHGKPTLLTHGDLFCTDDIAYQAFRKKSRNRLYQALFLIKPLAKRQAIANELREISRAETSTKPDHIMDVNTTAVVHMLQHYGVTQLIHGHTHRPNIHEIKFDETAAKRYVLGAWHEGGHVLACPPGHSYTLTAFAAVDDLVVY